MKKRANSCCLKLIVPLALVLGLGGCGFQPLYGEQAGGGRVVTALSQVVIEQPGERRAQMLRNRIIDRLAGFGGAADSPYRVSLAVEVEKSGAGFLADNAITRADLRVSAHWLLRRRDDDKPLLEEDARTVVSYNVVQSDFANLNAEQDAEARALALIGERISSRLALYFANEGAPEATPQADTIPQ